MYVVLGGQYIITIIGNKQMVWALFPVAISVITGDVIFIVNILAWPGPFSPFALGSFFPYTPTQKEKAVWLHETTCTA